MFVIIVIIIALELMGPRYRTFAGMVICMFFATAMCLLALLVSTHYYCVYRYLIQGNFSIPYKISKNIDSNDESGFDSGLKIILIQNKYLI